MAFHPYPRVIGALFNALPFGPPRGLTPASACPWVAHPASRPRRATERPVQTRSRCGSVTLNLAAQRDSLAHSTKGTPSHRQRCSDSLRARGFRYCFTPLPGCFSPFPHGTGPLSVTGECSGLEGGPPSFPPGLTCPAVLGRGDREPGPCAYGAVTRFGRPSHAVRLWTRFFTPAGGSRPPVTPSRNPGGAAPARSKRSPVWPSPGFARRYSRDPVWFLFLGVLRCFSSPGCLPEAYVFGLGAPRVAARRVRPFGDPGITGRVPLPPAYRSSPRPSKASCA